MLGMLAVAWVGYAVIWFRQGIGAALVLGGLVAFLVVEWAVSGRPPYGWVFPALMVPGVLAALASLSARTSSGSPSP